VTLFRLDASIQAEGSASREIADIVEAEWLAAHPGDRIERRHIGVDVLPASAWAHAVALDAARAAGRAFSLANA
jgi:FMN-dependent NADH-azoreductase